MEEPIFIPATARFVLDSDDRHIPTSFTFGIPFTVLFDTGLPFTVPLELNLRCLVTAVIGGFGARVYELDSVLVFAWEDIACDDEVDPLTPAIIGGGVGDGIGELLARVPVPDGVWEMATDLIEGARVVNGLPFALVSDMLLSWSRKVAWLPEVVSPFSIPFGAGGKGSEA